MPEPDPLVLEEVVAGYGGRTALHGVSLTVGRGEVVGVIGPNGSGKTTLIRVASRTLAPRSGRVLLEGRDPYAMGAREAARLVAVVPQELAPSFSFSALEVVLMGRSPYRSPWSRGSAEDYRRVRDAAESARIQHLLDRPLDELSGGEKQRVVLAQALAQDAPVLLLDEPTTHLDLRHVVGILEAVRGLARGHGTGVLAVFHDLNLAAASCDRVVALDAGRVVAQGPPEDVLTPGLIEAIYGVPVEVLEHPVTGRPSILLGGSPEASPPGRLPRAHVVGGAGRGARIMRMLAEEGFEVTAGVLHAADTDAATAERLNIARVSVPPFSAVDETAEREVEAMMREAEVVVVCDAPFGPGNVGNLRAALRAAEAGVRVVLLDEHPIGVRDFTGGEAGGLWERLRRRGEVVSSYRSLRAALAPTDPAPPTPPGDAAGPRSS